MPNKFIVIGSSAGGPPALLEVLSQMPPDLPVPILIAQHMPPGFSQSMANSLAYECQMSAKEAEDGEVLEAGSIYVAPTPYHTCVVGTRARPVAHIIIDRLDQKFMPSIDLSFESVAKVFRRRAISVVMSGMPVGKDGTLGSIAIKCYKGVTIAQSPETSIAPGMPRAAIEAGAIDHIVPLGELAQKLLSLVSVPSLVR